MMQSLILALYPMLKGNYHLNFTQIGLLSLTYQITASVLQPLVGMFVDRSSLRHSLAMGMGFTLSGIGHVVELKNRPEFVFANTQSALSAFDVGRCDLPLALDHVRVNRDRDQCRFPFRPRCGREILCRLPTRLGRLRGRVLIGRPRGIYLFGASGIHDSSFQLGDRVPLNVTSLKNAAD